MSGIGNGSGRGAAAAEERGARAARLRALAVLRVRSWGTAVALLPAAVAVVLIAGGPTGHLTGSGWDAARWAVTVVAVLVLLVAGAVALVIARARPAVTPTVELAEPAAPDLYRMVQDLADRLGVPAPSAIALTPDCDSWLEDRTHPAHGNGRTAGLRRSTDAPVLVIGSPFLWWMRVGELRAVLAPVVAGTGPSAQPDIAAARRFVQGLDAAVAAHRRPGLDPVRRLGARGVGAVARVLLRSCRGHAAEMERGVAVAASERAQAVDYGVRIVAQEQVGLAYAGWDRLLTRVALPAWRMGRWPSRLDAGVVSALTELSRRDRLAEGFTSRLGERPACDLLEEPGAVDEAASLLAARLFHGGPAEPGPDWAPVHWQQYPEEVVDRKWRTDAARLHGVLDRLGVLPAGASGTDRTVRDDAADGPTLARVLAHLSTTGATGAGATGAESGVGAAGAASARDADGPAEPPADALAAALTAEVAREEARRPEPAPVSLPGAPGHAHAVSGSDALPLFPLQPPRTGRDLLADHVTAMVCCAAVDTAGARPGLDWLDGPALFLGEERQTELTSCVLTLVEDGDPDPLRVWLARTGVRPEKPVRLV
ncbi:hypothetical protein [Streptomyces solicathayae]|uniref:Integral membrane protein n=1 Tax=Streptomyces solicathayae TaxID=3081768 RepID=A0ABZ0LVF7_9ACTN|nr:hypothetical protein [Streptomyces sp. HUAS YS2]WOX23434.1 hypothetical protein R2D22_19375 [Streptomyces sp. HUAS YS2]